MITVIVHMLLILIATILMQFCQVVITLICYDAICVSVPRTNNFAPCYATVVVQRRLRHQYYHHFCNQSWHFVHQCTNSSSNCLYHKLMLLLLLISMTIRMIQVKIMLFIVINKSQKT